MKKQNKNIDIYYKSQQTDLCVNLQYLPWGKKKPDNQNDFGRP